MPRLRMPPEQQEIFDDLRDFVDGARMINAPQLARYWGRDVRCIREWLESYNLTKYKMQNGYAYALRDVSRAMYLSQCH